MTFREALRELNNMLSKGRIYGYRVISDSEGYKTLLVLSIDNEELVFFDERSYL